MNCKKVKSFISEYKEGTMNPIEKVSFEKHIEICPNCAVEYKNIALIIDGIKNLPEIKPSYGFDFKLRAKMRNEIEYESSLIYRIKDATKNIIFNNLTPIYATSFI